MRPGQTHLYTISLDALDQAAIALAGGKAANLGTLRRMEGIRVPDGFVVTTDAFSRMLDGIPALHSLLDALARLGNEQLDTIALLSRQIRSAIETHPFPEDVAAEVALMHARWGRDAAYAVRSSATAEDLPSASFAGQQDTFLQITGYGPILQHIARCWASLFTERAISYRMRNGFDHRKVHLAVIVQRMVVPRVSGVAFTADPVTGNRKVMCADAVPGLGDQLVSGRVIAAQAQVRDGKVLMPSALLTNDELLELEVIARSIEANFGSPQDIEWCLAEDGFYVVQSRPITTLFPIPQAPNHANRVYVSVGHQQMMTDPIRPLGLSFYLMITPATMRTAAGRLFVDVTPHLSSPESARALFDTLGRSEPLIRDALTTVLERPGFIAPVETTPLPRPRAAGNTLEAYPELPSELIGEHERSLDALKERITGQSGTALMDLIEEDIGELKRVLFQPKIMVAIMAGMNAAAWINAKMEEWLGEMNAADVLSQSVRGNVTSEMGLALLDVADVVRPFPEVVAYLQNSGDDDFRTQLGKLSGGPQSLAAIDAYLEKYGMRGVGEIDLTRPRWCEQPSALFPLIISNIKNFEPGEATRKLERGLALALQKEKALIARLKLLPDGEAKAREAKLKIDDIRNYAGFREYPKYGIVSRYQVYKNALMREAARMVSAGSLHCKEDIFYLFWDELRTAIATGFVDNQLIAGRKEDYRVYEQLVPPRVITSEGEVIAGRYNRTDIPAEALPGLAVSAGIVEGRARILLHMEGANLQPGDILVTPFTDPSWTPVFVTIKGLVTEVGGLMTHGAVIAREYGLPAVVCVEHATRRIRDGQRIRVNGTEGYVEIIDSN